MANSGFYTKTSAQRIELFDKNDSIFQSKSRQNESLTLVRRSDHRANLSLLEDLYSEGKEIDIETLEKLTDVEASYLLRKKLLHK